MISDFPISSPEAQGLSSSALWALLDELEREDLEVTGMRLVVNGHLILHFCRKPYEPDGKKLWYSVTKAFTGIGVGIACDQKLLSIDDFVISFFPDQLPESVSKHLGLMRVRHLLSMSCGIHENTYHLLFPQDNWVKAFLAQEFPHEPGTYYRYSTHASHMLAAIVEKAAGISFYDFIKENLLAPLGIGDMSWEFCRQGITCGGMGLSLSEEAVTRFGYMLLNGGLYKGKRIVSAHYLAQALTEQSDNRILETSRHKNGYGFHMQIDRDGSFYHGGSFGQLCYVSPAKNAVLTVTSRKNNSDQVINLFQALFVSKASNGISYANLRDRLNALSYPPPRMAPVPAGAYKMAGQTYSLDDNALGMRQIQFQQDDHKSLQVHLDYADRPPSHVMFNFSGPSHGLDTFVKDIQYHLQKYCAYAVWLHENTLLLTVLYIETPYVVTYNLRFEPGRIIMNYHINVSFGIKNCTAQGVLCDNPEKQE